MFGETKGLYFFPQVKVFISLKEQPYDVQYFSKACTPYKITYHF